MNILGELCSERVSSKRIYVCSPDFLRLVCQPAFCRNGGSCSGALNPVSCRCPVGFGGIYCHEGRTFFILSFMEMILISLFQSGCDWFRFGCRLVQSPTLWKWRLVRWVEPVRLRITLHRSSLRKNKIGEKIQSGSKREGDPSCAKSSGQRSSLDPAPRWALPGPDLLWYELWGRGLDASQLWLRTPTWNQRFEQGDSQHEPPVWLRMEPHRKIVHEWSDRVASWGCPSGAQRWLDDHGGGKQSSRRRDRQLHARVPHQPAEQSLEHYFPES